LRKLRNIMNRTKTDEGVNRVPVEKPITMLIDSGNRNRPDFS
jgi:hypothetical protein